MGGRRAGISGMADEVFSGYASQAAQDLQKVHESGHVLTDWVFNMFAAAIMFTDIVGYSKQMGANEAAMVKKLNIHNEIMSNQIVRNCGTVIKTIGDAFMVCFRSAENAV